MAGLPLAGVRVLDLTRLLPGPFCTLLLADFGADVIKVEDLGEGDYARTIAPEGFLALNRNKRSIRIDLKTEGGRDVLLRLARGADVVVESFRPGVLERLGVGHEALLGVNPGLVVCPITGYGQTGPYRDRAGHDLNYVGMSGLLDLGGEGPDAPPVAPGGQIGDIGGGALMAAFGILAALRHRDRTGEGQVVDVAMTDGVLSWLALSSGPVLAGEPVAPRGRGPFTGAILCYRVYRCADGWVTCAALEPKFWAAWCAGVGRDDLVPHQFDGPGSPAHADVERIFAAWTRDEWAAFNAQEDCCVEPVLDLAEVFGSELAAAREMVVTLDDGTRAPGVPVKMSATPGDPRRRPPPGLGEHTDEVLGEAGLGDEQIAALRASGCVG